MGVRSIQGMAWPAAGTGVVAWLIVAIGCWHPDLCQAATTWQTDITVSNAGAAVQTVTIGADTTATEGIDEHLGELPLPPPPPQGVFEVRLLLPGGQASVLDLRPASDEPRVHVLRWQAGSGGYPILISWDSEMFPPGSASLADAAGGIFVGPIDMTTTSQVEIGSDLSFLSALEIAVDPSPGANEPPSWDPIPGTRVFAGQRLRIYELDDFASDFEDATQELVYEVDGPGAVSGEVNEFRQLELAYGQGWTGVDSVRVTARDLAGAIAEQWIQCSVSPPLVTPNWRFAMEVTNQQSLATTLVTGLDPDATVGLDPELGELELPPPPPPEAFDARLRLPAGDLESRVDVQPSPLLQAVFTLVSQPGDDGWPLSIQWSASTVPPGNWSLIPVDAPSLAVDPRVAESLVLTEADVGPGSVTVLLDGQDLTDTDPPSGLVLDPFQPQPGVPLQTIGWSPVMDANLHFYDLVLADSSGYTLARYDRWNDASLLEIDTDSLQIPWPEATRIVELRAWDRFGNVAQAAQEVTAVVEPVPGAGETIVAASPNPFNPVVRITVQAFEPGDARLEIHDVRGYLVRTLHVGRLGAGDGEFVWNARDDRDQPVPSSTYLVVFRQHERTASCKIQLVR